MIKDIDTTKKISINHRGGRREGAGRKPSGSTNVNNMKVIGFAMRPNEIAAFKRLCKETGKSYRAIILERVLGMNADYANGYERD